MPGMQEAHVPSRNPAPRPSRPEAGADGFFAPGLIDIDAIARLCERSPVPVNIMMMPGAPSSVKLARAGVARISHGPGPYKVAMSALRDAAEKALDIR